MTPPPSEQPFKPLLFLGHPGHELRLFGLVKRLRPEVWLITDGSGSAGSPRTQLTREILNTLGATAGPLFGRFTDGAIYTAIMTGDSSVFVGLARELRDALMVSDFNAVVSDSPEGYNPSHDLCHVVAAAAVAAVRQTGGRLISHFDFPLTGDPRGRESDRSASDRVYELDEETTQQKINTAMDYARRVDGTLLREVEAAKEKLGTAVFRNERLMSVKRLSYGERFGDQVPYYEQRGEERARSGHYSTVLRYREHMLPIANRLEAFAAEPAA